MIVILLNVLNVLCAAFINKTVINVLEKKLTYSDSVFLQYSNNLLNKVVTKGGAIFRGYYLKKIYKLPYSTYASTIAGVYIVTFLSHSVLGLITLLVIYRQSGIYNALILILFSGLLLATLFLIATKSKINFNRETRIGNIIGNLLDGWEKIRTNPKELMLVFLGTFFLLFITLFKNFLVYNALGADLGIVEAAYMSSVNVLVLFINITPAGIGIQEGVYMFSSQLIGLNPDIILLGSLVLRAIVLIPSLLFGGISYMILLKKMRDRNVDQNKIKKLLKK